MRTLSSHVSLRISRTGRISRIGFHTSVEKNDLFLHRPTRKKMITKPLNEHMLWKGKIQEANYTKPLVKPPMKLPEINSLTGKPKKQDIHSEINRNYAIYSMNYWFGVKQRAALYRQRLMQ